MNYKTISQDGIVEEEIKKSRFICHLKRVETEDEARDYIASIKKLHHKANHSCSAFILGQKSDIKRSSDDGEPSGTAGVPMLTVLEKQELTNVVAVVTRYFGGIKLGAGGLIRAYAGSVAGAIAELGRVEVKRQEGLKIQMTYPQYQNYANFLAAEGLQEVNTQFLTDVTTQVFMDKEEVAGFTARLTEFYNGKVTAQEDGIQIVEVPLD